MTNALKISLITLNVLAIGVAGYCIRKESLRRKIAQAKRNDEIWDFLKYLNTQMIDTDLRVIKVECRHATT